MQITNERLLCGGVTTDLVSMRDQPLHAMPMFKVSAGATPPPSNPPVNTQPATDTCVASIHKSIRIYMRIIILGANTLYIVSGLFMQIPMASKELIKAKIHIVDEIYREKTFINFAAFSELTAFAQLSTDCFHEIFSLKFRKVSPYCRTVYVRAQCTVQIKIFYSHIFSTIYNMQLCHSFSSCSSTPSVPGLSPSVLYIMQVFCSI